MLRLTNKKWLHQLRMRKKKIDEFYLCEKEFTAKLLWLPNGDYFILFWNAFVELCYKRFRVFTVLQWRLLCGVDVQQFHLIFVIFQMCSDNFYFCYDCQSSAISCVRIYAIQVVLTTTVGSLFGRNAIGDIDKFTMHWIITLLNTMHFIIYVFYHSKSLHSRSAIKSILFEKFEWIFVLFGLVGILKRKSRHY